MAEEAMVYSGGGGRICRGAGRRVGGLRGAL
jgi:hypothetical protein